MHVNPGDSPSAMIVQEAERSYADCRIVVLAKEPAPARVKTRLCPPLTPETAARCHEAFVLDTLSRLSGRLRAAAGVLALTPGPGGAPRLERIARDHGWDVVDQGEGDLGDRIRRMLEAGIADRRRVVLIGADTPDLPLGYVRAAFAALERATLALGPATDGGYYLVGCRDVVPDIFGPGIEWGTSTVWKETLARARAGAPWVTTEILPVWSDVDDWPGLVELSKRIASSARRQHDADEQLPSATLRVLDELRAAGAAV